MPAFIVSRAPACPKGNSTIHPAVDPASYRAVQVGSDHILEMGRKGRGEKV